ncbi:MAG: M3 family metallopeptidase [Bacteroidales bacterium]|nr:M3 family metallopeptidase [Bacteroidales bacterium]
MKKILIPAALIFAMTACQTETRVNPFLVEWNTPYGIPPYEEILPSDYVPAIQAGIEQQNAEIGAICANPDAPTFENTIEPLELSGRLLAKVAGVFYNVTETDRTEELGAVEEQVIPLMSEHENNISFNKALYNRVAAVYNADQSGLTREQQMVLKKRYEAFQREGIGLPDEQQARLRQINADIATKTQKIGNNILAESNDFLERFGFSVAAYPDKMTTTEDRELRRQYNEAYTSRGHRGNEYDNRQLLLEVLDLRAEKARILGYPNAAAYLLSNKMAGDPQTVDAFLGGIMKAAVARAKEELADMQAVMDQDVKAGKLPAGSKIEAWDWWYYAEKVRKAKYDLDESLTKPYFQVDSVVNGIFTNAHILYGVNFERLEGVPVYNPEVRTYKVTAEDGSLVGIFTTDYKPRASKRGGAWMNNVRDQYVAANGDMVRPIIVNVCNFTDDYLSIDEVETAFHEFGHALHGLLSQCRYASVSGTSVTRDFVEVFSQFNENWAFQPELLARYAKNAQGETIPDELVQKIRDAKKFNQGFMTAELCAASILDMRWHELESTKGVDIDAFEKQIAEEIGLIPEITYRYRSTYFNHIFSSGYAAGYYGYLWAEVLDKDAFSIFAASPDGPYDLELAKKFKETFLEKGGSEDPMTLYTSFAGREPDNTAMLQVRGLVD